MYAYLITSNFTVELGPPNDVHFLVPGTCNNMILHGKRDFADVIKDLEIILDYSGEFSLIMWVLKVGEATFPR